MNNYKHEISSGAVVYSYFEDIADVKFLLVKNKNGHHWSFPKGHIEIGETIKDTALREIEEETGLKVKIQTNDVAINTYSPYEGCLKDVYYFLAQAFSHDFYPQESEIDEIVWATKDEVVKMLTYANDLAVFNQLVKVLKK